MYHLNPIYPLKRELDTGDCYRVGRLNWEGGVVDGLYNLSQLMLHTK